MHSPAKLLLACGGLAAAFAVAFCFRKPEDARPPLVVHEEPLSAAINSSGGQQATPRLTGRIEPLDPSVPPATFVESSRLPAAATLAAPADSTTTRMWTASHADRAPADPFATRVDAAPPPLTSQFPAASFGESASPGQSRLASLEGAPARPWDRASALEHGQQTHKVADGDTLTKLAQRYLGNPGRYLEIFEANRDRLKTPNVLPIGAMLHIPARGDVPATAAPAEAPTPGGLTPIPPGQLYSQPSQTFETRTYRVQPDDTLASIARRFYGDASRHTALLEANRDRLSDPTDLREGLLLVVP